MAPLGRGWAAALLVACAATTAAAQQAEPSAGLRGGPSKQFQGSDLNRDGVIGRDEMNRMQNQRFIGMDLNQDRSIDLEEFSVPPPAARAAVDPKDWLRSRRYQFTQIDYNADGRITEAEFERRSNLIFNAIDANGDGGVTEAELVLSMTRKSRSDSARRAAQEVGAMDHDGDGAVDESEFAGMQAVRFARADENRNGGLSHAEFAKSFGANNLSTFESMDVDANGEIGKAEFSAAGHDQFLNADVNNDGRLTTDELAR